MNYINLKLSKFFLILIALFLSVFFFYSSLNLRFDASSDTLKLQNDQDFEFYNYYNDIFPNKNFLVLAIKSTSVIDQSYIKKIHEKKTNLLKIEQIESIFSIVDVPILISSELELSDLNSTNIPTIKDNFIDLQLALDEFSSSPIFKDQIISKDKKTSALIIYPKQNNEFYKLNKERNIILKQSINDNNIFND